MGVDAISDELKKVLKNKGIEYFEISLVGAQEFYDALKKAKTLLKYSAYVDLHTIEEYSHMKTYLSEDKQMGIAVEPDNNIVSVFNASDRQRMSRILLPLALENGGDKLDNFDGKLSILYSLFGFIPVSKVKFDVNCAPDDWNYERDNKPDIIFWMHNGMSATEIAESIGQIPVPSVASAQMFDTYEEARECRNRLLEARKNYADTIQDDN